MKRLTPFLIGALAALSWMTFAIAQAGVETPVAIAPAKVDMTLTAMKERSARIPSPQRARAQSGLETSARKVDNGAAKSGETTMATRLAAEFGVPTEAIITERTKYELGWGEMVIAHTLAANVEADVTPDVLYGLRKQGMGWGDIAAGLGLSLQQTVGAVNAETQVALGLAKADGKVKRISAIS